MFNPLWILWLYLIGIPISLYLTTKKIGENWEKWYAEARHRSSDAFAAYMKALGLISLSLIWPIGLLLVAGFMRGSKVSKMRKAINKRLKEAEAEILRIKKQEGWS